MQPWTMERAPLRENASERRVLLSDFSERKRPVESDTRQPSLRRQLALRQNGPPSAVKAILLQIPRGGS
jgi:hypothetical protein